MDDNNTYFLNKTTLQKENHFWIFVAILSILSLFMIYCCNPVSAYPGYDYFFHLQRFNSLIDLFRNRQFIAAINYNAIDGYGYLVHVFYSDITLIPFILIGIFTGSGFAYQLMLFTITFLTGYLMYLFIYKVYKNTYAGYISGILYAFCTYRLYDMYHRAAIGEAMALTFLPIVFLGLYYIIKGDYKRWYVFSIGFSLLIFTHLLTTILTFIVVVIILLLYCRSLIKQPQRIKYLILSAIVTIPLIACYLFPMMEQMLSDSFYFRHRPATFPVYHTLSLDIIGISLFNGFIYDKRIVLAGVGVLLTILIPIRLFIRQKSAALRSVDIGVILGICCILATSSYFPWGVSIFKALNIIQFPFRLFIFPSFFFAVAGGYYLSLLLKTEKRMFIALLVISGCTAFVIFNHAKNYKETREFSKTTMITEKPTIENDYHLIGGEYIPQSVPSMVFLDNRGDSVKVSKDNVIITNFKREKGITSFTIGNFNGNETILELPLIYYKGYNATIDGQPSKVSESENGLIQLETTQQGSVIVQYAGTFVQKISLFITIIAFISLCIYIFVVNKRRRIDDVD